MGRHPVLPSWLSYKMSQISMCRYTKILISSNDSQLLPFLSLSFSFYFKGFFMFKFLLILFYFLIFLLCRYHILKIPLLYLVSMAERCRNRKMEIPHLWIHSPNVGNTQGWTMSSLGARNSVWVSYMDEKRCKIWKFMKTISGKLITIALNLQLDLKGIYYFAFHHEAYEHDASLLYIFTNFYSEMLVQFHHTFSSQGKLFPH